jgi:hypothetical protein
MKVARWIAPLTMAAALALSVDASAGDLQVRDDAHVFASSDAAKLRAVAASVPFDARIVTTTAYPDQAGLSRYVGGLFSEPNMVVIGIDPDHHHVQVHFGTGSHVPRGSWSTIERSGNDSFRQSAWEQGSETILREAASSVTTTAAPATGMPTAGAAESHGSFFGPLLVVLVIAGVVGIVVMLARRRGPAQSGPYGGGPYAGGGPFGPSGQGGPGPYYGPQGGPVQGGGGMGPLGGGLIGAGLGGLAGYELGKAAGEREEHERDVPFGGGAAQDTTNSGDSFDAGGGGSSWDDTGGGDVGGFDGGDSGGGGSEF